MRLNRWWTHPYGDCVEEGCPKPAEQFMQRCTEHVSAYSHKVMADYEAARFERDVQVAAEALRRVEKERQEANPWIGLKPRMEREHQPEPKPKGSFWKLLTGAEWGGPS